MAEQSGIILFLNRFGSKKKSINNECKDTTNRILINNSRGLNKLFTYIKDTSYVALSAQIILLPIIAYNYKTISITFVITNILTSYLLGIIIIFGFLLVLISFPFFCLAKLLGRIYKLLIGLLLFITEHTSKIPFFKIYIKAPFFWEIALYYALIFTCYYLIRKYRNTRIISKI